MKRSALTLFALCLASASLPMFQSAAALSDSDIAVKEAKLTASVASDESAALKEKFLLQQSAIKALTESLANANNEAEGYKREAADLRMKIETLGVVAADKNSERLQQRLLAAVRDLRLAQQSGQEMRDHLLSLSEAIVTLLKSSESINPQMRLAVETELRGVNEMLGAVPSSVATANAAPATLTEGMVIGVKDDLALIVANIGKKQDVKVGMPFQIFRNDKPIAEVRMVDVRDRVSGAIVYNLASEKHKIEVGDRLKVATRQ